MRSDGKGMAVKTNRRNLRSCRGQGMVEYLLVIAIVVAVTFAALSTISVSVANLVNAMVNNIETVTGVADPA